MQVAALSVDRFYHSGQIRSRSLNFVASNLLTFSFVPSHLFACYWQKVTHACRSCTSVVSDHLALLLRWISLQTRAMSLCTLHTAALCQICLHFCYVTSVCKSVKSDQAVFTPLVSDLFALLLVSTESDHAVHTLVVSDLFALLLVSTESDHAVHTLVVSDLFALLLVSTESDHAVHTLVVSDLFALLLVSTESDHAVHTLVVSDLFALLLVSTESDHAVHTLVVSDLFALP